MTKTSHISSVLRRAVEEAKYIIATGATIRATAKYFGVSKSTIHRDIRKILEPQDKILYEKVQSVIQFNKSERHLRGGEATRIKCELIANKERQELKKKSNLRQNIHSEKAI
jgi:putative DeoR family transcriptional regulator (stage III sporulation protein D)